MTTERENELANKLQPYLIVEEELRERYDVSIVETPDFIAKMVDAADCGLAYLEAVKDAALGGEVEVDKLDAAYLKWVTTSVNALPPKLALQWAERLNR